MTPSARTVASTAVTAVTVACALASTGILVRRELVGRGRVDQPAGAPQPVRIQDWTKYLVGGHQMGDSDAKVTILEFGDFECPICSRFANGPLRYVRAKYPNTVQVVYRNWPLPMHHLAYPAARAAECAAKQGRFEQFHDALFATQDSLGIKTFWAFARTAGVPDSSAFSACIADSRPVPSIEADIAAAKEVGALGTPTLVINGLRISGAPDTVALERMVREALKQ